MVKMVAPLGEIGGGLEARKSLEVVDKMSLVEITAAQSDIRPLDLLLLLDEMQHCLKAPDAAE